MPLIIGLAGTIAAGKSTVGQILVQRGAVHCDGDKLIHTLYEPGKPGFDRVVAAFGPEIVGADGFVDRKALGAKVFGKPEEMNKLTTAIGSIGEAIKGVIDGWRRNLPADGIGVMEAVNLMEPGYASWCDQLWLIAVDDDIARRRLQETRGMSLEEANQRLKAMVPVSVRAPGCDWVYHNNTTREALETAVEDELGRVRELAAAGELPGSVFHQWWAAFIAERRPLLKKAGVSLADEIP
ncbi:MAG: dephospho-CoA kinase [Dehalococcoidia bacterium]